MRLKVANTPIYYFPESATAVKSFKVDALRRFQFSFPPWKVS